ncbi:unnamed protein product [Nippostrongylus brasiliensis]|uniref:DUF4283 domain-containing protein n=1 Tax=Nippostrongylus brasiliensis TaxID=27835 RepID=A0A0N4XYW2_NIPBR|nr:unnamed protein product [Nippostrongylus brasiliensis]
MLARAEGRTDAEYDGKECEVEKAGWNGEVWFDQGEVMRVRGNAQAARKSKHDCDREDTPMVWTKSDKEKVEKAARRMQAGISKGSVQEIQGVVHMTGKPEQIESTTEGWICKGEREDSPIKRIVTMGAQKITIGPLERTDDACKMAEEAKKMRVCPGTLLVLPANKYCKGATPVVQVRVIDVRTVLSVHRAIAISGSGAHGPSWLKTENQWWVAFLHEQTNIIDFVYGERRSAVAAVYAAVIITAPWCLDLLALSWLGKTARAGVGVVVTAVANEWSTRLIGLMIDLL